MSKEAHFLQNWVKCLRQKYKPASGRMKKECAGEARKNVKTLMIKYFVDQGKEITTVLNQYGWLFVIP
jgi:hypothetical protein